MENWFLQKWETGFEHQAICFCEKKWRRYGLHGNCLFCFVLSFSTAVPNRNYSDSKTSNKSIVCIGLFVSLFGAHQSLVCLIIVWSWSGVLELVAQNNWWLRRYREDKSEGVIWEDKLQMWETGFEHLAINFFIKRSEGDLVHMEIVCFVSSWVSPLTDPIVVIMVKTRCVCCIVNLTLWISKVVNLINNCLPLMLGVRYNCSIVSC